MNPSRKTLHSKYSEKIYDILVPMKVSELLDLLRQDGWFLIATRGSHRQFKHLHKPGRVTVAGKPSDDLSPGTLNSILKQSGLKPKK
jgi:predicted RNA binding protein YcfA (HicA-like mRNA interferase family)